MKSQPIPNTKLIYQLADQTVKKIQLLLDQIHINFILEAKISKEKGHRYTSV